MQRLLLNHDQSKKFALNILKFTAPALGIFFAQLASGVDIKPALLVASYALYALLSDYFTKLNK